MRYCQWRHREHCLRFYSYAHSSRNCWYPLPRRNLRNRTRRRSNSPHFYHNSGIITVPCVTHVSLTPFLPLSLLLFSSLFLLSLLPRARLAYGTGQGGGAIFLTSTNIKVSLIHPFSPFSPIFPSLSPLPPFHFPALIISISRWMVLSTALVQDQIMEEADLADQL